MPISHLSDAELSEAEHNLIYNNDPNHPYNLMSILQEKLRRSAPNFDGRDLVRTILLISQHTCDRMITYKDLWEKCHPDLVFRGNNCVREIMRILGIASAYCSSNNYPIVTSIVVRKSDRRNTPTAKHNMREAARDAGIQDLGPTPEAFVNAHATATLRTNVWEIE